MRPFLLAIVCLFVSTGIAGARAVRIWPYQELFEKSDLAVVGTPAVINDTKEHFELPGFKGEPVTGVNTRFAVCIVLKGDRALRESVLHHYRTADGTNIPHVPNGPTFVAFGSAENPTAIRRAYILFVLREADGR